MATNDLGPDVSEEPTIGRLVAETTKDLSTLVRDEIQLAKTELKISLKLSGAAAGLFAAAVFLVLLAVVMISIAFGYALTNIEGIGPALAFLIVFGVYVLIALILAFIGYRKIKKVRAPEQTIAAVKSNKQILKRG
jgi:hypothetical protein